MEGSRRSLQGTRRASSRSTDVCHPLSTEVSPFLAATGRIPRWSDRFELFIAGREIANGFSELNDPVDQRERFVRQLKERADEADAVLNLDEDFFGLSNSECLRRQAKVLGSIVGSCSSRCTFHPGCHLLPLASNGKIIKGTDPRE